MSTPTKEELKIQAAAAGERLADKQHAIRKLYEDQQRSLAVTSDCWFDAELKTTALIFYSSVELKNMNFSCSSTVLEFHGTSWGPGLGKFRTYGGGLMTKDPSWLIGKEVDFELAVGGAGVGAVQMTFWYEGAIIGAFDALGGGVGISVTWGSGTFKKV